MPHPGLSQTLSLRRNYCGSCDGTGFVLSYRPGYAPDQPERIAKRCINCGGTGRANALHVPCGKMSAAGDAEVAA